MYYLKDNIEVWGINPVDKGVKMSKLFIWFKNLVEKKPKFIEGELKSLFIQQAVDANPMLLGFASDEDWLVWEVKEGEYGYAFSIEIDGKHLYGEW